MVFIPLTLFVRGVEHRVKFGLEIRRMGSAPGLPSVCTAVWPRTSDFTSLASNVLICHTEVVAILILQELSELNKG